MQLQVCSALMIVALGAESVGQTWRTPRSFEWCPVAPDRVGVVVDEAAVARLREKAVEERTSGLAVAIDGRIIVLDGDDAPIGAMSVSKSITSLAFGMLVDDGAVSLEDSASKWLPEWRGTPHEAITIYHLLSHTSGLNPVRAELDGGDIRAHAVASDLVFEPGSRFQYCNNAVDLLAVIAEGASGKPLDDFLEERLFEPLGITDVSWLEDSHGVPFAAGELQISPSGLLRVGQMLVDGGVWDGRRILSEEWIERSTRAGQPYVPSVGLLWNRSGDFRLALTPSLFKRWGDADLPEEILDAVEPLVGQSFPSFQLLHDAVLETLGQERFAVWRDWLRAHREVEYADQILVGDADGFYATGWLGQYLVVHCETSTVAVRMRVFMEVDIDRSKGEQFNFSGFVDDVVNLAEPAGDS